MLKKVTRNIKILKSQARSLSMYDIASLFRKLLYLKERILIYVKELDTVAYSSKCSEMTDTITKGTLNDLEKFKKNVVGLPWEFMCNRYDGVKDFFIYKNGENIGHISWVYYKGDPNRLIDLGIDEGEIKYCLTLSQFRGKGIYPATLKQIQRYLKESGYNRVFICVKGDNRPSVRGIEKAEFKLLTEINLIKIMGIQISKRYATSH